MAIAALTGQGQTWRHGLQVGKQLECTCGHEPPLQFWQKAWGGVVAAPAVVTPPSLFPRRF
jgi:hypothetical protein